MEKIKEALHISDEKENIEVALDCEKSELIDEELEEIAGGRHQSAESSVKTRCNV